MATGLETFLEAIARLPGMSFLEKYANQARNTRYAIRSHKERAEEIAIRSKGVKESANIKKKQNQGKAAPETAKDIRKQTRRRGSNDFEGQVKSAPRKTPDPFEKKETVRDTSPLRDKGRSLRKRKEDI